MQLHNYMHNGDNQTIIAQCTPHGSGALALLRLSGADAIKIASHMSRLTFSKQLSEQVSHTIHYGWVIDNNGSHIDQVMFSLMHAPKTFTGEQVVEITCHNNPFIIEAIIEQALAHGARLAQEGEFTKRALLNGKLDLVQAEALNELIHANTQMALKKSLAQLEGTLSHHLVQLENPLYKAYAFSESSFEFIDEEMEFGNQINELLATTLTTIAKLKQGFEQQQQIRQGIRIALIGTVNAGKSSLFNALLHKERAIVSPQAGTTRDVIEAGVYKKGNYWTLIDTAGLRKTHDSIEQEGIRRSFQEAQLADIILLVFDQARSLEKAEKEIYMQLIAQYKIKIIVIANKKDLPTRSTLIFPEILELSTKNPNSIRQLEDALERKIGALFACFESPFLLNKRQFNLLIELENNLHIVQKFLQPPIQYELVSHHLKIALENLSELSGKTVSEKTMDTIFREFCVGK